MCVLEAVMPPKRNFLSQLIEGNRPEKPRRNIKLKGTAFYLKKGLRGYNSQKIVLQNISETDCLVACPLPDSVDDHVYLVIDNVPAKFACAVTARSETTLDLRFCNDLPAELVERLATPRF
jgi:hypothetical protein